MKISESKQLVFICGVPSMQDSHFFELWIEGGEQKCVAIGEEPSEMFETLIEPTEFAIKNFHATELEPSGWYTREKKSRGKGKKNKPWQKSKFNQ